MDPNERQNNSEENEVPNEDEVCEEDLMAITEDGSENAAHSQVQTSPAERLQLLDSTSREQCVCTRGNAFAHARSALCPFCGKNIQTKTTNCEETSSRVLASQETLHLTLAGGMESIPQSQESSLYVQAASRTDRENIDTGAPCTESQTGNKTPVERHWDPSVQMPCPSHQLTYYILKREYVEPNEMTFSLYFVDQLQEGKVALFVQQMERQLGIPLQAVSFGYENSTQHQHFHTVCLTDGIKVKFELLRRVQRRFRLREEQETFQVPLMHILSLCKNRIPGSIAQVHVEPLCEPGEICQDHLRMTIDTGQTIHRMLIPIWPPLKDNYWEDQKSGKRNDKIL